jgi:hypothetical protein
MKNTLLVTAALTFAAAAGLQAGGFWLETGDPQASQEARAANAVLVIRVVGCHDPQQAGVTANAIGTVDGRRVTTPLRLVKLSIPGAYAVARQWPVQGQWALEFVATSGERVTSAVLPAIGDDVPRHEAKYFASRPTSDDINAVLAVRR